MGCGNSRKMPNENRVKSTKSIDKLLKEDAEKAAKEVKLLLLGTAASGKSTILKQVKIIHNAGFKNSEKETYKTVILENIVDIFKCTVSAMEKLNIHIEPKNKEHVETINDIKVMMEDFEISEKMWTAMKHLRSDTGFKECLTRYREYQLCDSASYYIDNLERFQEANYLPSEQDILRSRASTTGVVESNFMYKKTRFRIYDVGGQRSQRKKWIHCFDAVTAVIFVVAISEYDLVLAEDGKTNRMQESLALFDITVNNKFFDKTTMVMFLNKYDIFVQKILKSPLQICFPDYHGENTADEAGAYIRQCFERQNTNQEKRVYSHLTCATDTNSVENVFKDITDGILRKALQEVGMF